MRARSVRACGSARLEAAVPLLRDRLLDPDRAVRGAAAGALGRIGGARCTEALMRSLRTHRLPAARLSRELARSAPDFYLETALAEPRNRQVRTALALALGLRGASSLAGAALGGLLDGDNRERAAAYHALGALHRSAAVPLLVRALSDGSPSVRHSAARALLRLGERGAVEEAMGDAFTRLPKPPARRGLLGIGGWRWRR